jgi:hypothetical protein
MPDYLDTSIPGEIFSLFFFKLSFLFFILACFFCFIRQSCYIVHASLELVLPNAGIVAFFSCLTVPHVYEDVKECGKCLCRGPVTTCSAGLT